jgi:hypothetical protein
VTELRWGAGEQRLHPVALAKHGYAKATGVWECTPAAAKAWEAAPWNK